MSSYGSMSPSDEGFDRYEPPYYCQPLGQQGSPMDHGIYWQTTEHQEYDPDLFHGNSHFIGRHYAGYEEMQGIAESYENYAPQGMHHNFTQSNIGTECPLQRPVPFVRVVKRRNTANKKERRRTQSINTAFTDLRECIPNVPADTKLSKRRTQSINCAFTDLRGRIPNVPNDTKLSKIKTLRLATSYISYLSRALQSDTPASGFRAELPAPTRRARDTQVQADKKGKGRTGWPQDVWALELKNEQNTTAS